MFHFPDDIVFEKSLRFNGRLSGMQFPDDLILSYSKTLQNFVEPISFGSAVNISGTLSISDTLNGYNFSQMCDLLEPKKENTYRLTIKGMHGQHSY